MNSLYEQRQTDLSHRLERIRAQDSQRSPGPSPGTSGRFDVGYRRFRASACDRAFHTSARCLRTLLNRSWPVSSADFPPIGGEAGRSSGGEDRLAKAFEQGGNLRQPLLAGVHFAQQLVSFTTIRRCSARGRAAFQVRPVLR